MSRRSGCVLEKVVYDVCGSLAQLSLEPKVRRGCKLLACGWSWLEWVQAWALQLELAGRLTELGLGV